MLSCIYEGTVSHRRREPVEHQFRYRLFMVYLDLDELPELVGRRALISSRKLSTRSLLRQDHLYESNIPLAAEVRNLVAERTGLTPTGPIRLLSQLRYFGYYMSPLNLFYCFDSSGTQVEMIVAEVNNTPWNERHCYVLWSGNRSGEADSLEFQHQKDFHVSPFMSMDMQYRWRLDPPSSTLKIHLANARNSQTIFEAGMSLKRQPLSRQNLRRMTIRYPFMTAKILTAIYFQALQLWWKKCPSYTHPMKQNPPILPKTDKPTSP